MDFASLASSNFSFNQAQLQQYIQFQTQVASRSPNGSAGSSLSGLFSGTGLPSAPSSNTSADLSNLNSAVSSSMTDLSNLTAFVTSLGSKTFDPATASATSTSAIDPASIVAGVGLGAINIPQPPAQSVYEGFNQIQQDHKTEQSEYLSDMQYEIAAKRQDVFTTHHYEIGADGKKTLVDGGETSAQRAERTAQEKVDRKALQDKQKAEVAAYTAKAKAFSEKQLSAADSLDPEKKKAYQAELVSLQKEEAELNMRQQTETLKFGTEGLPDPDDPTGTRTLDNSVDFKMNEFSQLVARHDEEETTSAEGRQIIDYATAVQQFTSAQQATMNQLAQETGLIMDPKAIIEKFGGSLS